MNKFMKSLSLWVLIILGAWLLASGLKDKSATKNISYSTFKDLIKSGKVTKAVVKADVISGEFDDNGVIVRYKATLMNDPNLISELEAYNVPEYRAETNKSWVSNVLWYFGPVVLLAFLWFFMIKQMNSSGKSAMMFGKTKAKPEVDNNVTFNDVAGCDEEKEELKEIIAFLKDPQKFQKVGGKIPKGVLLSGAPGTGKTLLAKAVAGEASVPFFSSSGSEFVEMFVGVGASRVRDLFDKGRKNAPCLLFIDEIDAVGRHRFAGIGGGHDEREQTLNQILVEMDGFNTTEGVILIAATNRPDVLDPALTRPGRFDRQVTVYPPDLKGREEIIKVHTKKIKLEDDLDLSIIARRTPGFVGADLANLCNEAALLAARYDKKRVSMVELEEAIERVIAGPEKKSRIMSEKEKKMIAYHESGHAVVAKILDHSDPVHKVSIVPRGPALGYTLQLPREDKYLTTKKHLLSQLAILLGGRAAEEIFCQEETTGAQNDLSRATSIASKMVCEFGMSESLGKITYRKDDSEIFLGRDISKDRQFSNETLDKIDEEIRRIVDEAFQVAKKVLIDAKSKIEKLVVLLIEKESISGEELDSIIQTSQENK
ncbi:MAG: ATP-dependent metallopeptidase FtsH/Yme1/Tma family protein [bacterium]|nr:ATP-dependent metallopeptidase FtsH/Yme1/Tma family protein [bacterium]